MTTSRRTFIRSASALAAQAGLSSAFSFTPLLASPADTIRVAAIGINGMGWADLNAVLKNPGVECVALCDVDKNVLDKRAAELAAKGTNVKIYGDYRQLLDDKSIDAVVIGTPDHWHCLMMAEACEAGKDVYVEKPIGNSIAECRSMVAAQKRYNRVVQVGQWQRSQKHFRDAIQFVHSGKLGKIGLVKVWGYFNYGTLLSNIPDSQAPAGVDYQMWLGPAPKRPFNANRFHGKFRWYWDYAGGIMTDWGVHLLDYALLGMKAGAPKRVSAAGNMVLNFGVDAPDSLTTIYEFDGFNIQWEHAIGFGAGIYGREHGIAFMGGNGTLILDRGGWEVVPQGQKMEAVPFQKASDNGLDLHAKNFVDVIRSRTMGDLNAPIEVGAEVAILSQMGNIAYRIGAKLEWNADKGNFNNAAANKLIDKDYHNGYKMPSKA
ncbi:Gfo/Idh/MocA family protein [Dyadobacter crusticola]|uniref:Gfo/Idh/MocA family protein n=1 Tax=Dyadobacter crusticola TaxID=292407 RepID=UPI0004E17A6A|nr:Gfo/Idh/MocA family oxidoreductase [Dyadobacter crusticola]